MLLELTQGYSAIIDDEDFEELSKYKWCCAFSGKRPYAVRTIGNNINNNRYKIYMHRVILTYNEISPEYEEIDHINGNSLDNRKCNLRFCTHQENLHNQIKSSGKSSIYKGVSFHKRRKKFYSYIRNNGILIRLGSYKNEIDAATAYDEKAKELHGEFARLNFPGV